MQKMLHADLIGIGNLLKQKRFSVPPHQRPYSWIDEQINDLYRDINDAVKRKAEEYFLGTIVLAEAEDNRLSIIDGQQRLVMTTILIAAIRDYFANSGQSDRSHDIEREYLSKRDIRTQEETAHIFLIPEDRDFFVKKVVYPPGHPDRGGGAVTKAQERIENAVKLAATFVSNIVGTTQAPDEPLIDLLEFIDTHALAISVEVGDESNAFVIFEVLNDRGLDLSVADLLKNYIFRLASDRVAEAQSAWQAMTTTITEVAEEPDVKVFIRQEWISKYGLTREKQLYDAIKRQVGTKLKAVQYAKDLAAQAVIYAALRNTNHDRWKPYGDAVIESLEVLDAVGVTQIRPSLLAVFKSFTDEEIKKALPMMVAWTVRFLICGSGGSGTLETYYAERAKDVSTGTINTATGLWDGMKNVLPTDQVFEETFAKATVSKAPIAKYYLRVLEQQKQAQPGELIVNPDSDKVNLEHVMPQTYSPAWAHIPPEQHPTLVKRLGNLALMSKRMNSKAANSDFATKKPFFAASQIVLTKELANRSQWTQAEIDDRQKELAKLAVKAWRTSALRRPSQAPPVANCATLSTTQAILSPTDAGVPAGSGLRP
jgi:hypothetical protein